MHKNVTFQFGSKQSTQWLLRAFCFAAALLMAFLLTYCKMQEDVALVAIHKFATR